MKNVLKWKEITLAMLFILSTSSCTTITFLEENGVVQREDNPKIDVAYFYGQFLKTDRSITDLAIILKNETTGKKIDLQLMENAEFVLIEVPVGTYKADFGYYAWDLLYWAKAGSYNVPSALKEPFRVEPGKIYYIGMYSSKYFRSNSIEDLSNFTDEYPNFSHLEIVSPFEK